MKSPQSAAVIDDIPIIAPYFINLAKDSAIPFLRKRFDHIIPARAPTGVKNAPMFDPITVA